MYATNSFSCVYVSYSWISATGFVIHRLKYEDTVYHNIPPRETMVQGKKNHPGEVSLIFGRGKGEEIFCVYWNWLSLHDAANG